MPTPIALDYRPALLSAAGIGRATRELAVALARRDDLELHLFGHCLSRARVPTTPPPTARLHRLPLPGRLLPWLARLGLPADRLAGRPAVFHWTDYVMPPVGRAARVLTVHDLAFVRDPRWHGPAAVGLGERTAQALAAADAVVVPSQATADDVRRFAPTAPTPRVIPFGADHLPERVAAPHPFGGEPYALCLGTLEPRKQHRALLAAWRTLPAPRPRLLVVGAPGWQCEAIVADLQDAVAAGLASWWPDCPDHRLLPALAHATALVYPSAWEGFGFPPLEAMRLGVPVIANDVAPLRELGAEAMQWCDAGDAAALAAAIATVFGSANRRRELASAGRRRAAAFRWDACAAAHAALYREVAG